MGATQNTEELCSRGAVLTQMRPSEWSTVQRDLSFEEDHSKQEEVEDTSAEEGLSLPGSCTQREDCTSSTVLPTSPDMSLGVRSIEMSEYEQEFVLIDVDLIDELERPTRLLRAVHVQSMQEQLVQKGYQISTGSLCVCLKEMEVGVERSQSDRGRRIITDKVWLIDGRHRKRAMESLATQNGRWCHEVRKLCVALWKRVDKKVLSLVEIVSIGASLNAATSTVLKTTFPDNAHTAVSVAHLLCETEQLKTEGLTLESMTAAAFAGALLSTKALGDLSNRHLQRYADVSLVLARSDSVFKAFCSTQERLEKQGLSLYLEHFSCAKLIRMDETGFIFCLRALQYRLEARVQGSFCDIRRNFYLCAKLHYLTLRRAAIKSGVSFSEYQDKEVHFGGNSKSTVGEWVCKRLATFKSSQKADLAIKARLTRLGKTLEENFEGSIEPVFEELSIEDIEKECVSFEAEGSIRRAGSVAQGDGNSQDKEEEAEKQKERLEEEEACQGQDMIAEQEREDSDADNTSMQFPASERKRKVSEIAPRRFEKRNRQKRKVGAFSPDEYGPEREDIVRALKEMSEVEISSVLEEVVVLRRKSYAECDVATEPEGRVAERGRLSKSWVKSREAPFDDLLPTELPHGACDAQPYRDELWPWWAGVFATALPGQWKIQRNPVPHASPYLEQIHIPSEHRSHLFVTSQLLRSNRFIVAWQAVRNVLEKSGVENFWLLSEHAHFKGFERIWAAVERREELALDYFGLQRGLLNERGYCILEHMFLDHEIPGKAGTSCFEKEKFWEGDLLLRLCRYFEATFGDAEGTEGCPNEEKWAWEYNSDEKEDKYNTEKRRGRFVTTNFGVTCGMEGQRADGIWKDRAKVDVRIGQIMACLGVWVNNRNRDNPMFLPRTGGRFIVTTPFCKRQQLHTDFESLGRDKLESQTNPGYFTICSSAETAIWVCENSHVVIGKAGMAHIQALSVGMEAKFVRIPPYSLFVGRGDIFHAGPAFSELGEKRNSDIVYQCHFVSNSNLPHGCYVNNYFKPRFNVDVESGEEEGCIENKKDVESGEEENGTEGEVVEETVE